MILSSPSGANSEVASSGSQGSGSTQINWDLIWRMKIPPKVRMFLWRATLDILPHYAELCRRRVRFSPFCDRCNKAEETTLHVLFGCRGLDSVWAAPPFSISFADELGSFWSRFNQLRVSLDEETFLLSCLVMWKAWEVRNQEVHDPSYRAPEDLVQWCVAYLDHFQRAQIPSSLVALSPGPMAWQAPPLGTVKVNVDVGLPRNSINAWVAMVARNDAGACLWWSKKMIWQTKPS